MTADKNKLELTIAAIQGRWGFKAIGRGKAASFPHIPTSFTPLDEALGIGGIPCGRITEIIGIPTSGMSTLALKIIANGQAGQGTAAYFDLDHSFDPTYAANCGIELSQLVLVRPASVHQAMTMLADCVFEGGIKVLLFDASIQLITDSKTAQHLSTTLGRIITALYRTDCALLFLTTLPPQSDPSLKNYPAHITLPHFTAVRLLLKKQNWLYRRNDVIGYQAQVMVVKNKHSPAGKQVSLTFTFHSTIKGDGT